MEIYKSMSLISNQKEIDYIFFIKYLKKYDN